MSTDPQFSKKQLRVTFDIVDNGFNGGNYTITLEGHRVACQVVNAGLESGVMCALRIEGMKLSDMNLLSTVQAGVIVQTQNSVTIEASTGGAWQVVFSGGVIEAFTDYNGAPNIAFQASALSMAKPAAMMITPTSFKDAADVATIMKTIADKAGLAFQNNGVEMTLPAGVYYEGSPAQQMQKVAEATRIQYIVAMNVLQIYPPAMIQSGGEVIDVSASTGMMGYPAYSQYGVRVRTLFNSSIGFRTAIKLNSEYPPAAWVNAQGQLNGMSKQAIYPPSNGVWIASRVQHDLQSETPDGQWTTYLEAARPDLAGKIASFGS